MPYEVMTKNNEVFEIGVDNIYFNKKEIQDLQNIQNEIVEKKNNSYVILLCSNDKPEALVEIMSFLKDNNVENVSVQSLLGNREC